MTSAVTIIDCGHGANGSEASGRPSPPTSVRCRHTHESARGHGRSNRRTMSRPRNASSPSPWPGRLRHRQPPGPSQHNPAIPAGSTTSSAGEHLGQVPINGINQAHDWPVQFLHQVVLSRDVIGRPPDNAITAPPRGDHHPPTSTSSGTISTAPTPWSQRFCL